METKMLIGSSFEAGRGTEETILNPGTGDTILMMPEASNDQIDRAVGAARHVFRTWSRTTPAERSGMLLAIADAVQASLEEFAQLEALNCGKPINEVRNGEIPGFINCFQYFAGAVRNTRLRPGTICKATPR